MINHVHVIQNPPGSRESLNYVTVASCNLVRSYLSVFLQPLPCTKFYGPRASASITCILSSEWLSVRLLGSSTHGRGDELGSAEGDHDDLGQKETTE